MRFFLGKKFLISKNPVCKLRILYFNLKSKGLFFSSSHMTNFLKKLTSKSSQVPQISHSLFDEDRPNLENKSFWSKDNLITDNKRLNLSTGCFFNKKSKKKFGEVKSVYLYIYKNFLISSKVPFLSLKN